MKHLAKNLDVRPLAMLLALLLALLMAHGGARAQDRPAVSPQELERTLAPIALYPDSLLSQILMASTYPLEVVEAARWSRNHPSLAGEDAVRAAANENWDPSVKSLLAFPHVLARMDENLQWLQTLGDAFLGQEPQVMDAVQNLRRRAQAAGNLRSDERQRIVESGPLLVVQPADPQIIYVPYYDPRVVYGPWWWPNQTPVYWRPFPAYYAWPGLARGFFWGPSIRISFNYFFGGFDWPHRHVKVVQNTFYYSGAVANQRVVALNGNRPPEAWQHDPAHRRGVAYRGADAVPRLAAATALEPGRHADREDGRRQDGERGRAYPTLNRSVDAGRPVVQAAVQPNEPARVQAAIRPAAQPFPSSNRPGEPRGEVRRAAIQPATETPAPAEIRKAAVTQGPVGADPRAEWRDHGRSVDRGERREPAATRPIAPTADAIPQKQVNRGHPTPSHEQHGAAHGDRAERGAKPRAGETGKEVAPSSAGRQETHR